MKKNTIAQSDASPAGGLDAVTEDQLLRQQIFEDDACFKHMLNLIPSRFYFSQDKLEGLNEGGKKRKNPSGEDAGSSKPSKKTKVNPYKMKSVTEVQEALMQQEQEAAAKEKKSDKGKGKVSHGMQDPVLQLQLQKKLQDMRNARKAKEESIHEKRLRRQEEKKKKKQAAKQNKAKTATSLANGGTPRKPKLKATKPIYNAEGKMVFSKFDFSDSQDKRTKSDIPTGKNYKKLLKKVAERKEKLDKLKATDEGAAKHEAEKYSWQVAIKKAEGVKVKDNPELLKKSIKRQEQYKKKSAKEWKERVNQVDKKIKDKQDKRNKNLKARKDAKVNKKIKKATKKGRMVPGF